MQANEPVGKAATHPILIIAAVAVVLFCGVGTAAILGWLPASAGSAAAPGVANAPIPSSQLSGTPPPAQAPAETSQATPGVRQCDNCGVVEAVREVRTRGQGSGVGAAGGAVLGGLLGNQVGSGHGRQLATVAGAIGGAVAGNQIEGNMNARHSYTIVVRMSHGGTRSFHQTAQPVWRSGDPVKVVNGHLRADD